MDFSDHLIPDALSYNTFTSEPLEESHYMDAIRKKLTINDYRSIFFLLIDIIPPRRFLLLVKKEKEFLENEFSDKCSEFPSKEAMLIEIFGIMQKNNLLKILGTCHHLFEKERNTFTQISPLWKNLYFVCEQLADNEVGYVKNKLFPDGLDQICCAEEVFCLAYVKGLFCKDNVEKLAEIFKDFSLDCFNIIELIKAPNLLYYPVKRPTRKSPCGIAVILNHEEFFPENENSLQLEPRPESRLDAGRLCHLWKSYGFKTEIYKNFTYDQVVRLFDSLSKMDHSSYDAFVACYLSHGAEDVVYASDCRPIEIMELVNIMANTCQTLFNKPKLFFIQACQGNKIQQGVCFPPYPLSLEPGIISPQKYKALARSTPRNCDVLLHKSSIPGFVSFRPSGKNSWFIEALIETMEKFGDKQTVANVMTKVRNIVTQREGGISERKIENCKQTPILQDTLRYELQLKKILFCPEAISFL